MKSSYYTLEDLPKDLSTKTVLVRADLDVPIENGEVVSDFRLRKAVFTIRELMERKARVVVIAHLGRPEGKYVDEFSLLPVRFALGHLLSSHIKFAHIPNSKNSIKFMEDGEVLLLENVRFHKEEESKDAKERQSFVEPLTELADYFVFDAFASYRQHASTYELPKAFKKVYIGSQMEREIEFLTKLRDEHKSPYIAVIGGAKLDTKIDILEHLVTVADSILIGGAMAYTFLKAKGLGVGKSMVEDDKLSVAEKIIEKAKKNKCELLLPIDHIASKEFKKDSKPVAVDTQKIPDDLIGLDIGERTLASYLEVIKSAKTILWNGPMCVFEWEKYARGTEAIGEYIGLTAPEDAFKVAGGGDTVSAMDILKINMKNFDHVSTGGGAMLSFIAKEKFPVLEVLKK